MTPREALAHIRTLIRAADGAESIEGIQKLHREVLRIVERGLTDTSNVVPLRPNDPGGPKAT